MAEIDGGALSFKSVIDNGMLDRALEETMRRIKGLSDATVAGGEEMDKAFMQTTDGIRDALGKIGQACEIHESELAKLEEKYRQLGQKANDALSSGDNDRGYKLREQQSNIEGEIIIRKRLLHEARGLSDALEKEAQKLEETKKKTEENAKAHQSLRSRIKELKEEMALLIDQGIDEQSEAYKRLVAELGRLQDIQGDIAQQGKTMANDEVAFQGVIQGISGIAGGLSAATGAVSLFAGENENLQKVMTKVQSVMAITIGLQQVAQTLNKDSSFMLHTVRKAKELLTVAETKFATALGVSNAMAKTLMATLTLGLSVAITGVVVLLDKIVSKNNEAKKAQENFSNAVIDGAIKPIGSIEKLSAKYKSLGDDMKAKEKFVKDNQKAFEELGVSVKNVTDAENLLIQNKEAFVSAQFAKAKALAYSQIATEKIAEKIKLQAEHDKMEDNLYGVSGGGSAMGGGTTISLGENLVKKNLKKEIDKLGEDIKDLFEESIKEDANYIEILNNAGIKMSENTTQTHNNIKKTVETNTSAIREFTDSLKEQLGEAENVLDKMKIIAKEREKLTEEDKDKHKVLADAEKDIVKGIKSDYDKSVKEYEDYVNSKLSVADRYIKEKKKLEEELKKAETPEQKKVVQTKIDTLDKRFVTDKSKMYDELVVRYRTYEEDITEINKAYDIERRQAEEKGNRELVERIEKARRDAISRRTAEEFRNSDVWSKMFDNVSELSTSVIDDLIQKFEANKVELGLKLSPEDMKEATDAFNRLKVEARTRNPFKGVAQGIADLKNAANDDQALTAMVGLLDSAAEAGAQLKAVLDDVLNTLDALGVEGTEEVRHVVGALEGIGKGAKDAILGAMSGNPVQMVGGAIKAIGSVVNYFAGANDRRAERSIKKHQENVNALISTYKELEWQIGKSLSSTAYKHQKSAIDNMRQQQRELDAMIEAERSKKKADEGKIKEWQERKRELDRSISDSVDNMRRQLLATDAKSIASELGNALTSAFLKGEDGAKAWGDTVRNVINNLVKNLLIQKVLEAPIEKIIKKYTSRWVNDKNGMKGFEAVENDVNSLASELEREFPKLEKAFGSLKSKLKFDNLAGNDKTLTGAVKGVTEETASIVAGQLNAVRMHQVDTNAILRNQLLALNQIAHNTSYNKRLDDIYREMRKQNTNDPLRSKGLN